MPMNPPMPALDGPPAAAAVRPQRRLLRVLARAGVLLVAVLVVGNGAILGLSVWARSATPMTRLDIDGVRKGVAVDERVWRGAAPSAAGYRNLAAAGVTTIVDLRSDSERGAAVEAIDDAGLELVRLPVRDGQLPTEEEVARFLRVVEEAEGRVFVHCGAGVGRTGAMAAAYLAAVDEASGPAALRRNLAVGPPSLEQIAFAASGGVQPNVAVTAMSRVLDAPRRIWHNLT